MRRNALNISIRFIMLFCVGWLTLQPLYPQDYAQRREQVGNPGGAGKIRRNQLGSAFGGQHGELGEFGEEQYGVIEDGEEEDTTARKRKIRKPLESYLFDDSTRKRHNFAWHIDTKRNRVEFVDIDTSLNLLQIDYPFLREGVGDAYQGNIGAASIPLSYFDRPSYRDFSFGQAFDRYFWLPDRAPHYNVKKPFSHFNYLWAGQKRYYEENFGILHAQNISPSSGFNINYKSRGERGRYEWSKARAKNLHIGFAHTGKRYTIHAGYIYNAELNKENGGIVDDLDILQPDKNKTGLDLTENIPVRLADARMTLKNNTYYIVQSYGIPLRKLTEEDFSIANRSSIFFGHSFEYNRWYKRYEDTHDNTVFTENVYSPGAEEPEAIKREFYENWYINPSTTRDSIFESRIANRLFIQIQPFDREGIVGTIDAGVGVDNHYYYQFVPDQFISGVGNKKYETDYYLYGSIDGKFKKYLSWGADAEMHPTGFRNGDMSIEARLDLSAFIRNRPITLSGRFLHDRRSADYWTSNLFSNHFVWNNSFKKENETRIEALLSIPSIKLELGAQHSMINDKIYFGRDRVPVQHDGSVNVTGVYARKDFRAGGFHFNHRVLLQWSTSQEVIPVPTVSAYLSYLFEFSVVKNVLKMQIGIDGRYNTKYYAFGYNPATSQFYNQREKKYGGYPMIDLFVNAKWKRMRILLKVEHLTEDMIGSRNYFTLLHYPQKPRVFKFGISWTFYD